MLLLYLLQARGNRKVGKCAALRQTYKKRLGKAKTAAKTSRKAYRAAKRVTRAARSAKQAVQVAKATAKLPAVQAQAAAAKKQIVALKATAAKATMRATQALNQFVQNLPPKQAKLEVRAHKATMAVAAAKNTVRQVAVAFQQIVAAMPKAKSPRVVAELKKTLVVKGTTVTQAHAKVAKAQVKAQVAVKVAVTQRTPAQAVAAKKVAVAVKVAIQAKKAVVAAKVAAPTSPKQAAVVAKAVAQRAVVVAKQAVVAKQVAVVARRAVAAMAPAAAKKPYRAPFTFASSSGSDDPHFQMFDGGAHDVMVWGWFTWVKTPVLTVQVYSSYCGYWGGPEDTPRPPTCIKRGVMQVVVPGTSMRLVVTSDNYIKEFGTSKKVGTTYLEGRYTASSGRITSTGECHADPDCALSARVSRGSVAFQLPRGGAGYGKTNGLMGFFSGDKSVEGNFKNLNGSPSTLKNNQRDNTQYDFGRNGRGHNARRTNGPRAIAWSKSFMVGLPGNPAIDLVCDSGHGGSYSSFYFLYFLHYCFDLYIIFFL
jgi:hypothetical protein